ncbi:MAG: YmdB family metallophosphoesterase [Clostridia bacterium]|nr:YmdB family metallophosphoesterase [Clostridia bacterium]
MRILTLGDVVGSDTVPYLRAHLSEVQRTEKIDFTVANGENVTEIRGISPKDATGLLDAGVDLITLGNHAFGLKEIYPFLDANDQKIIRPANFPPTAPGNGYTILNVDGWRLLCISISGRAFLDPLACPFETLDKILAREEGAYDLALLDIHGEATSEKLALAYDFDGKIQVMFGTHTHVPTADERVLPHGSGYITDLGMCGPTDGIIGTDRDDVIRRFRTQLPTRFNVAKGDIRAHGAIFDLDESACRVRTVKRIVF